MVRQYTDGFVVPMDPPDLMMSEDLKKDLGKDQFQAIAAQDLLLFEPSYADSLLPRLAPRVEYVRAPAVLSVPCFILSLIGFLAAF